MLILCNNKGCMKTSEALLDTGTKDVLCQACGGTITNVTDSMRRTLKSFGQIVRVSKKAFMLLCPKCKTNREVVFDGNKKTVCKACSAPISVTPAFKTVLEDRLKNNEDEEKDSE